MLLPSEIETRFLIPAGRSLIARELIKKYNFSQENVASLLGITQAAVSNYISGNRGNDSIIRKGNTQGFGTRDKRHV
ncbi:MAG: helix-turn-helix domain-containing protein [Nitrososphaerales archaeon]